MTIAIIGTGNVGSVLGTRMAHQGHRIIFASRNPQSAKVKTVVQSAGSSAQAATLKEAAAEAEVILLALPYTAAEETLRQIGPMLDGKTLIDTTNALLPDLSGLALPPDESAGENIAAWAPGARVVKAFNTVGTRVMEDPQYGDDNAILFICGDHSGAKDVTAELAADLGFEVIDAGPLKMSRHLESLAMLWIQLAFVQEMGTDFGLKIIKR